MKHRAANPGVADFCGYYWHSTRLARKGTDYIFNDGQQAFQKVAKDGKIGWAEHRELMFTYKKTMDQLYRNMMWHFTHAHDCNKCEYWDNVYTMHLAKATVPTVTELTDAEMLEAVDAMDVNGSN